MIHLLCFNVDFLLFHSISPLSFFRARFLPYLAFSSLSPNNLSYLLFPTITPFLTIVSFPFFCCCCYFQLMEAWGPLLCVGGSSSSCSTQQTRWSWSAASCVSHWCLPHCRRGSPMSILYLLCRSIHNLSKCRAVMNQVFDANKKQPHGMKRLGALQAKKEKKMETEKDAAVKNTNIGSSRKPPYCIHYCNLLICSGLMLSILRLSWLWFPILREQTKKSQQQYSS